jgi:opacity protein-like surface antigen
MRFIAIAASVALLASAATAFAAEQTNGIVQSVNPAAGTLTLQSGQSFQFANATVLYGLLPGQDVGVTAIGSQGIGAFDPSPANRAGDSN